MTNVQSRLPIEKVAFGVRYTPQYRVRDNMGTLVDRILRSDQFSPDTFPRSEAGPHQHALLNPGNGDRLVVSQDDVLLDIELRTESLNDVEKMAHAFDSIIIRQLRNVCKISDAFRFGLLVRFEELHSHSYECPVERYADKALVDVSVKTLNLQFSYNLPTPEGFTKRDVGDYRNVIYTMNQEKSDGFSLAVDYQQYFEPILDAKDWTQSLYEQFARDAIAYHQGKFSSWVDSIAKEARAAA